jgi:hypothetical protein
MSRVADPDKFEMLDPEGQKLSTKIEKKLRIFIV